MYRHAHGGYTASLIFSASRAYFLKKYPSSPKPDPINSHIQFISPVVVGAAKIIVQELNASKLYASVQIEIRKEAKDGAFKTCVLAIMTQGNLALETGQTFSIPPTISKKELP